MDLGELLDYLAVIENDSRLNVWHFALLSAILYLGYRQGQKTSINVSRSKIMDLAHIHTLPTYHKYFKQLQEMEYIRYIPSYHPSYRSKIDLLIKL
ncbi:hypothetical protein [Flavobacterium sp. PL02]|uniref:hypothetical protein n=1 Tax=Flavobacterium sp. PL02 TaxID=3088354 RepID=UPI002B227B95|nr:hypothetical protein [Flavobacterium sp. PL02]MEA9412597.1 hypothetical protein [Flavobacterium sp. PL02]